MRKIGVLVLGTYRSGTSALTGVLHGLGFNSNYKESNDDYNFSPTGSYNDNYFDNNVFNVDWSQYFAIKNQSEKWCCKHHLLLQNNLCQQFHDNFPPDTQKCLIITERKIENSIKSMNSKSSGDYSIAANNHKLICENLYNVWNGKKTIINFNELINNTENCIKSLCNSLEVDYLPEAISMVKKGISQFEVE